MRLKASTVRPDDSQSNDKTAFFGHQLRIYTASEDLAVRGRFPSPTSDGFALPGTESKHGSEEAK